MYTLPVGRTAALRVAVAAWGRQAGNLPLHPHRYWATRATPKLVLCADSFSADELSAAVAFCWWLVRAQGTGTGPTEMPVTAVCLEVRRARDPLPAVAALNLIGVAGPWPTALLELRGLSGQQVAASCLSKETRRRLAWFDPVILAGQLSGQDQARWRKVWQTQTAALQLKRLPVPSTAVAPTKKRWNWLPAVLTRKTEGHTANSTLALDFPALRNANLDAQAPKQALVLQLLQPGAAVSTPSLEVLNVSTAEETLGASMPSNIMFPQLKKIVFNPDRLALSGHGDGDGFHPQLNLTNVELDGITIIRAGQLTPRVMHRVTKAKFWMVGPLVDDVLQLAASGSLRLPNLATLALYKQCMDRWPDFRAAAVALLKAAPALCVLRLGFGICEEVAAAIPPSVHTVWFGVGTPDPTRLDLQLLARNRPPDARPLKVELARGPGFMTLTEYAHHCFHRPTPTVVAAASACPSVRVRCWSAYRLLSFADSGPGPNLVFTEALIPAVLPPCPGPWPEDMRRWGRKVRVLRLELPLGHGYALALDRLMEVFSKVTALRIEGNPPTSDDVRALCRTCIAAGPRLSSVTGVTRDQDVVHALLADPDVSKACPWLSARVG